MTSPTEGATRAFEAARLRIAHLNLGDARELEPAVRRAVVISGESLGVTRVGVWMLSEDRRSLAPLYVLGRPEANGRYAELPLATWPAYAAAIDGRRAIAADDARTDPRTCELARDYLVPLGITSMVDAPIFLRGQVWGIVCHEHVGDARAWKRREVDFAISVADMLSALFEQAARLTAEQELRRREAESGRQRKNQALVQMGAGVAHDFGNVLQAISLLAERAGRAEPHEAAALIREECTRGQQLVAQLLDFARSSWRPPFPLDLALLVANLRGSLQARLGPGVALETTLAADTMVGGNQAQLERVVTNLVVNARDSMPNGGVIRIEVAGVGEEAFVSVADQGKGIPEGVRERIFEPFFTTRTASGGTGLGLATVALITEQHGGRVGVDSTEAGSTFTVYLPRA